MVTKLTKKKTEYEIGEQKCKKNVYSTFFFILLFAAESNKYEGSFLSKDDPKINALMQQAELLSSLALKVNAENTEQSLESAWKVRAKNILDTLNSRQI